MPSDKEKKKSLLPQAPGGSGELSYLQQQLGISRQRLMEAVRAVGKDRRKIEKYLIQL